MFLKDKAVGIINATSSRLPSRPTGVREQVGGSHWSCLGLGEGSD